MLYTAIVSLPVFFVGAYGVRLENDLGFGTSELGFALSCFPIAGALAAGRLGPLVDRIGTSASLRIASLLSACSALIVGLAASGWQVVAVGMLVCGLGNSLGQMASNRLLARWVGDHRQGVGFGAKQAAVPVASAFAGLTVSLLGLHLGWRLAFTVLAAGSVAMALAVPRSGLAASRPDEPRRTGASYLRRLMPLVVTGAIAGTGGSSLALLVVDSFHHAGMAESTGAAMLAVGSAVAIGTRLAAGWYVDRRRSSGFAELLTLLLVATAGFGLLFIAGDRPLLLIAGATVAFAAGWGWNGVVYYAATRDRSVPPATASGLVLSAVMTGSVAGPLLVAVIADHAGYNAAWGTVAVMLAFAAMFTVVSRKLYSQPGRADSGGES